jgi:tetratricopeptide (TPR) repeat protein
MAVSANPNPAPEAKAKSWEQYYEAGRRRFAEGDAAGAEQAFRDAITQAELPGGDPLQLASSLSSLGQLKYQQKDYTQAENCFQRSLTLRERALGPDHPIVISGINNLAASYVARGALDEAEPLLQRAMAVTLKRVEATQAELAVNLNNLVRVHVKRSDYARAEPLLLHLLALKRPLGPDHPDVAAVLVTLAKLRFSMGRPAEAERLWRRVLAVRERSLPAGDLMIAGTMDGLADTCAAQGKRAEELEFRERSLVVREAALGSVHPSLDPLRTRVKELREVSTVASPNGDAGTATRKAVGAGTNSPPKTAGGPSKSAMTGPSGPVAGGTRPNGRSSGGSRSAMSPPEAIVGTPTSIPELEMSVTATPASRNVPLRNPGLPSAEARAATRPMSGKAPSPTAVTWIEPNDSAPAAPAPAPRPTRSDRRANRKLQFAKHTPPPTSGVAKFVWLVMAVGIVGAGGFFYGPQLWGSVGPRALHLVSAARQVVTGASHARPLPAAVASASTHGATPATTSAVSPPPVSPPPTAASPVNAPAVNAAPVSAPVVSRSPNASPGSAATPGPAAPQPVPVAARAPTAPAAPTSPTPSTKLTVAHERPKAVVAKRAATAAPPALPVVAPIPSADVDAAAKAIDDATKPAASTGTPAAPPSSP